VGFVIPAHLNPVVREVLLPPLTGLDNVLVVEPVPYGEFCRLMSESDLVLSDSGGVQEEAPSLGKPLLLMRETTERPEGVEVGAVRLVGTDDALIVDAVAEVLADPTSFTPFDQERNPYGDGRAAERSVAAVRALFGIGSRAADFDPGARA
jgi:UDP-N-acetylglucosamine 2-epimerase (non-hydrolysing)